MPPGALLNGGTGSSAADISVRDEFAAHFAGFTGTFVMYDPAGDKYIVYNEPQSKKRLSPCSTFKIYNSLIGLETGVLDQEDVYTLFKWNGTQYSFPYWNHDHTLASATRSRWCGTSRSSPRASARNGCREYIDKIGYGNKDISGGLTTFWLGSSLQISALEQVDLLNKLYSGQLPFSAANTAILQKNITLSEDGGTKLMGKTGSALRNEKWVSGWFVGCQQGRRYYVFATNIEAADGANGGKAREITKSILKEMGIL